MYLLFVYLYFYQTRQNLDSPDNSPPFPQDKVGKISGFGGVTFNAFLWLGSIILPGKSNGLFVVERWNLVTTCCKWIALIFLCSGVIRGGRDNILTDPSTAVTIAALPPLWHFVLYCNHCDHCIVLWHFDHCTIGTDTLSFPNSFLFKLPEFSNSLFVH